MEQNVCPILNHKIYAKKIEAVKHVRGQREASSFLAYSLYYRGRVLIASSDPNVSKRTKCDNEQN